MTNSRYMDSIKHLESGDTNKTDPPYFSLWRFFNASNMLKNYNPNESPIDYAFKTLSKVQFGDIEEIDGVVIRSTIATTLSIVYDKDNHKVYFNTYKNKKIRYFNLESFDFSCKTPVKVLDIYNDYDGDVSKKFIGYTYEINKKNTWKTSKHPDIEIKAKYPETTICTE